MRQYPAYGWVGVVLIVLFWALNWGLEGLRTHILFFPLWLGYALAVDALVAMRTGTSPIERSPRRFCLWFVLSAPAWWLFELFNKHTANWQYVGSDAFSNFEYAALATLSFSTVMPAVFGTAELVRSFSWVDRLPRGAVIRPTTTILTGFFVLGLAIVVGIILYPRILYPFVWGSVFFIVEPVNVWTGRPSLFGWLRSGDWRPVISLALGALICGFFWEFWNVYSFPKWTYDTPGVNFWHVFEMPLLGYLGYLPFGLELLALGHLLRGERLGVRL